MLPHRRLPSKSAPAPVWFWLTCAVQSLKGAPPAGQQQGRAGGWSRESSVAQVAATQRAPRMRSGPSQAHPAARQLLGSHQTSRVAAFTAFTAMSLSRTAGSHMLRVGAAAGDGRCCGHPQQPQGRRSSCRSCIRDRSSMARGQQMSGSRRCSNAHCSAAASCCRPSGVYASGPCGRAGRPAGTASARRSGASPGAGATPDRSLACCYPSAAPQNQVCPGPTRLQRLVCKIHPVSALLAACVPQRVCQDLAGEGAGEGGSGVKACSRCRQHHALARHGMSGSEASGGTASAWRARQPAPRSSPGPPDRHRIWSAGRERQASGI